jgi:hypothetical protein
MNTSVKDFLVWLCINQINCHMISILTIVMQFRLYKSLWGKSKSELFFNKIPANELCMLSLFDLYRNYKKDSNNLFYINSIKLIIDAIISVNNNDSKLVMESVLKEADILKLGLDFKLLIER